MTSSIPHSSTPPSEPVEPPSTRQPGVWSPGSSRPILDPSTPETARASLTALLNKPLRITTPDSRSFIGTFVCVDRQCNIILTNAEEFLPPPKDEAEVERRKYWPVSERFGAPDEGWGGRQVGMITFKEEDCVKIEILGVEDQIQEEKEVH